MNECNPPRNVREIDPSTIPEPYERKAVLAMQATVSCGSDDFERVNDTLVQAASDMGVAATTTYEDLIFVNPLETGAYVFSVDPAAAVQEALFYGAHRSIEAALGETIEAIQVREFDIATAGMQRATNSFVDLYRQLDPAVFAAFRPYFRGINGFPGPSGLFTAAMPIIDLLCHGGSTISEVERLRLVKDVDRGLYPGHQAGLLKDLLADKDPRVDMPAGVLASVEALLNRFRKVHTGSVRRFIPEALRAGAEGSGGIADVAGYLASKMLPGERSAK